MSVSATLIDFFSGFVDFVALCSLLDCLNPFTEGIWDTEEAGTDRLLAASSCALLSFPPTDLVGGSMARGCNPEASILALAPVKTGLELDVEVLLDCDAVLGESEKPDRLDTWGDFMGDNLGGSLNGLLFTFLSTLGLGLGSNLITGVVVGFSVFFCFTLLRGEMPGLESEVA